jgi:phosphotransferase system enzyme I (PtsP)
MSHSDDRKGKARDKSFPPGNATETAVVAPLSSVDPTKTSASPVFVHERGNRSLDGIFRLIEVAGQQQPLDEVLSAMCRDVAETAAADVVSIYVRESGAEGGEADQTFTMRGNVGFPAEAVGRVHLRAGEGIVGFVAQRMRPVSVDAAERDEHFKYVPGLGEERFPVMLAVPVVREGGAAGVLVLQRTALHPFNGEEVVLATALAAVISHALERAAERERERSRQATSTVARLPGVILSRGTAMGRAEILPTLAAVGRSSSERSAATPLRFDVLAGRLREGLRKIDQGLPAAIMTEVACLSPILDDSRLGERIEAAAATRDPLRALSELAREYARVPFRTSWNDGATADLMVDRAVEIEDLCVLAYAAMSGKPLIRPGAIVVAEHLRVFLAVAAIAGGASAFVIESDLPKDAVAAEIVRSAGRPFLASVKGVFSWVRPDDLLVVDAEAGSLRVNPEATAVARFRNKRTPPPPRNVP